MPLELQWYSRLLKRLTPILGDEPAFLRFRPMFLLLKTKSTYLVVCRKNLVESLAVATFQDVFFGSFNFKCE